LEEEQPIAVRELDPTAHLALQHDQLTSERGIVSLESADRTRVRCDKSRPAIPGGSGR
jgi:hypothetical protein